MGVCMVSCNSQRGSRNGSTRGIRLDCHTQIKQDCRPPPIWRANTERLRVPVKLSGQAVLISLGA